MSEPRDERERHIAHVMRYCQHYHVGDRDERGWLLMPRCLKGHDMQEKRAAARAINTKPGACLQPCIDGHELTRPTALCADWLRKTREEGERRAGNLAAARDRMLKVMPVVAKWRTWSKSNRVAKQEVIACPACGGRLHLSQAAYNGHVHGKCETEGCVSWME